MGRSIWTEINELRDLTERIVAGEFPTRSPLGPGQIQSKNIRARAITAPLINVSNLEAVNAQTGNLTVDGTITVSTAGKIVSGTNTDDWATFTTSPGGGQGYFHTYDATYGALVAFGDFNNVSGQYVKWDGTALTIKGVIVASSGSIAGWSITTDAIESPDGSVGMASSGHSSVAFWAGSVVPTSAEFYVTTAGDLVASSVDIRGDIWAETGRLDNLDIRGQLTLGPAASSPLRGLPGGTLVLACTTTTTLAPRASRWATPQPAPASPGPRAPGLRSRAQSPPPLAHSPGTWLLPGATLASALGRRPTIRALDSGWGTWAAARGSPLATAPETS